MKKIVGNVCMLLVLAFVQCNKKEIKGPQGDPGSNGSGGSSSAATSGTFVLTSNDWVAEGAAWKATIVSSLITADVASKGAVKVFVEINGAWWQLPFDEGELFTQCGFSEGKATLLYSDIEGGTPAKPATRNYRLMTFYESQKPGRVVNSSQQLAKNQSSNTASR
jgi:hypothetical protein